MQMIDRLREQHSFRHAVIAQWGRPDGPAPVRLFGKGMFIQHYAVDWLSPKALCGGTVMLVSERPFTTRSKLQCPLCVSVVARILVRAAAGPNRR